MISNNKNTTRCLIICTFQGRIQDFKLGGGLKKIAPSGGRRENLWGISCEKSRFYAKKSYFFQLDPPLHFKLRRALKQIHKHHQTTSNKYTNVIFNTTIYTPLQTHKRLECGRWWVRALIGSNQKL
jgi:hypothetical protein